MKPEVGTVFSKYKKNVYQAAFSIVQNKSDAEDVAQETFLAYHKTDMSFETDEHIRAWMLRTAVNKAKNVRTSFWHRRRTSWEEYMKEIPFTSTQDHDLFYAVMKLPVKQRTVIHLYYYEGLSVKEIASILNIPEGTVSSRMNHGRQKLKKMLTEEWENE